MHSNFVFLEEEFPILYNIGCSAEYNLHSDPVTTLWKFRVFEEKIIDYLFEEHNLAKPRENTLHNRIRVLEEERILQPNIAILIHNINPNYALGSPEIFFSMIILKAESILFCLFKVKTNLYK